MAQENIVFAAIMSSSRKTQFQSLARTQISIIYILFAELSVLHHEIVHTHAHTHTCTHAHTHTHRAFCYFNNVAVAAKAMLAKNKRVIIVDWVSFHFLL